MRRNVSAGAHATNHAAGAEVLPMRGSASHRAALAIVAAWALVAALLMALAAGPSMAHAAEGSASGDQYAAEVQDPAGATEGAAPGTQTDEASVPSDANAAPAADEQAGKRVSGGVSLQGITVADGSQPSVDLAQGTVEGTIAQAKQDAYLDDDSRANDANRITFTNTYAPEVLDVTSLNLAAAKEFEGITWQEVAKAAQESGQPYTVEFLLRQENYSPDVVGTDESNQEDPFADGAEGTDEPADVIADAVDPAFSTQVRAEQDPFVAQTGGLFEEIERVKIEVNGEASGDEANPFAGTFTRPLRFTQAGTYTFIIQESVAWGEPELLGDLTQYLVTVPVVEREGKLVLGDVTLQHQVGTDAEGNAVYETVEPGDDGALTAVFTNVRPTKKAEVEPESGLPADGGVHAGDVIEYTIDWKNTEATTANVSVTDVINLEQIDFVTDEDGLPVYSVMVEGQETEDVALSQILSPDGSSYTVKWTIRDVPAGAHGTVTFKAYVQEGVEDAGQTIENKAGIQVGNNSSVSTNVVETPVAPAPATWAPEVTKELEGGELAEGAFTFEMSVTPDEGTDGFRYSKDADGNDLTTATNQADGTVAFAPVMFWKTGAYTVTVTEQNVGDPQIAYDTHAYKVKLVVEQVENKLEVTSQEVEPVEGIDNPQVFTNVKYEPATLSGLTNLRVSKEIEGRAWGTNEVYYLKLEALTEGAPMPLDGDAISLGINNADASVASACFSDITYAQPGTYRYAIVELQPEGEVESVTFSQARYEVEVIVSPSEDGAKLVAASTMTRVKNDDGTDAGEVVDEAAFVNTPTPDEKHAYVVGADGQKVLVDGQLVDAGSVIHYEITWNSDYSQELYESGQKANVTITDTLPQGVTVVEGSISDGGTASTSEEGIATVDWKLTVTPGTSGVVSFDAKLPDAIDLTAGQLDPTFTNVAKVNNHPEVSVSVTEPVKQETTPTENPSVGSPVEFAITLRNTEGAPATVTVTDALTRGLEFRGTEEDPGYLVLDGEGIPYAGEVLASYDKETNTITWTFADMPAGQAAVIDFSAYITADALDAAPDGQLKNGATVQVGGHNPVTTTEVTVGFVTPAYFAPEVAKVLEGGELAEGAYTFDLVAEKTVRDGEPESTWEQTAANAADGTVSFDPVMFTREGDYLVRVSERAPEQWGDTLYDGSVHEWLVRVESDGDHGLVATVIEGSTDPVTFTNVRPQKTVTETPEGGVSVGDVLTYTVSWANTTGDTATVTVSDTLPAGTELVEGSATEGYTYEDGAISWTLADVAAGARGEVSFSVRVTLAAFGTDEPLRNQATVQLGDDPAHSAVTNPVETPKAQSGSLTVSKEVLDGESGAEAPAGARFAFTVALQDRAGQPLTGTWSGVEFVEGEGDLAGFGVGTFELAAGESRTIEGLPAGATYRVSEAPAAGFEQAAATGVEGTVVPGADAVAAFTNTYTPGSATLSGAASLGVSKTLAGRDWAEGESFTFELTPVTEGAPMPESSALTLIGPAGEGEALTGAFGDITYTKTGTYEYRVSEFTDATSDTYDTSVAYSKAIYAVVVNVAVDAQDASKLVATATVTRVADDAGTEVSEPVDAMSFTNIQLEDAKHAYMYDDVLVDGQLVSAGATVRWEISWYNDGEDGSDVTIVDTLPAGVTVVDGSISHDGQLSEDGTITWVIPAQAHGATGKVWFEATLPLQIDSAEGAVFENHAQVNNHAEVSATVKTPYKEVADVPEGGVTVGDVLTFSVAWENTTGQTADVMLGDTLTRGLTLLEDTISGLPEGSTVDVVPDEYAGETSLTVTMPAQPAGASGTVSFQARVNEDALVTTDPITNRAGLLVGDDADSLTNIVSVPKAATGTLSISKTIDPGNSGVPVTPMQQFTFTVTLRDKTGAPLTGTYALERTGTGDRMGISFAPDGTATLAVSESDGAIISGLPAGATYEVAETPVNGFTLTEATGVTGAIVAGEGAQAHFTNTVTPKDATFDPAADEVVAYKMLNDEQDGTKLEPGTFSFELAVSALEDTGATPDGFTLPAETVATNGEDGAVRFGAISFTHVGTYQVTIREVVPGTDWGTMQYDTHTYSYQVSVEPSSDNVRLVASLVEDSMTGSAIFMNVKPGKQATVEGADDTQAGVTVGDVITYQIGWANNTGAQADVVITDTLTRGQTFLILTGDLPEGATCESTPVEETGETLLVVTLPAQAAEASGSVTFQVRVNEDAPLVGGALTNTANVTVGDRPAVSTNPTEAPVAATGSLAISKQVTSVSGTIDTGKRFTFTVELVDKAGAPLTGSYAMTGAHEGTLAFFEAGRATLTLTHGESVTIEGLPAGAAYRVTETPEAGYTQTAPATEDGQAIDAAGTIAAGATAQADFTNSYATPGTEVDLGAEAALTKLLTGAEWGEGDSFDFVLSPREQGDPLPDSGPEVTVTRDDLVDAAGEVDPGMGASGASVATFGFGTIRFTDADMAGAEPAYGESGELLGVSKRFVYDVSERIPEGWEYDADSEAWVGPDGRLMLFDAHDATIAVTVLDDLAGHLVVTGVEVSDPSFTNHVYDAGTIEPDAQAGVDVAKALSGRDMADGEFGFVVDADNAALKRLGLLDASAADDVTSVTLRFPAAAEGQRASVALLGGAAPFTLADAGQTYSLLVREQLPEGYEVAGGLPVRDGVTYDVSAYAVELSVSYGDDGRLALTVTVNGEVASVVEAGGEAAQRVELPFENSYVPQGTDPADTSTQLAIDKTLTGRDAAAGEFSYSVWNATMGDGVVTKDDPANPVSVALSGALSAGVAGQTHTTDLVYTSDMMAEGAQSDPETGERVKDFYYVIEENVPGAATNPAVLDWGATDEGGNPGYKTYANASAAERALAGWTYEGVTYDTGAWLAAAKVYDDAKGQLWVVATGYLKLASLGDGVSYTQSGDEFVDVASFTNGYHAAPAYYTPVGYKTTHALEGADLSLYDGAFSYVVRDASGVMVGAGVSGANGAIDFSNVLLPFTEAGDYTFTISEVGAGTTAGGITYDATVTELVVHVEDMLDGTYAVSARYFAPSRTQEGVTDELDGAYFENTYDGNGVAFTPHAAKTLDGRSMGDGEFSFVVRDDDTGAVVSTGVSNADGTVSFGSINYSYYKDALQLVAVPSVAGMTAADAMAALEAAGLVPVVSEGVAAADAAQAGLAYETTPAAGTEVEQGTEVHVLVWAAPESAGEVVTPEEPDASADGEQGTTSEGTGSEAAGGEDAEGTEGVVPEQPETGAGEAADGAETEPAGEEQVANLLDLAADALAPTEAIADDQNAAAYEAASPVVRANVSTDLGDHHYTIYEVGGGTTADGVTYDRAVYKMTVTVSDNGDGTISAAVTQLDRVDEYGVATPVTIEGASGMGNVWFHNEYRAASTTATLAGTKTLTGRDATEGAFAFEVRDAATGELATVGTSAAAGAGEATPITFGTLSFTEAGTYEYVVSEVKGGTTEAGVSYDARTFRAVVTVTDDGLGSLVATVDYPDGAIAFTNAYAVTGKASVTPVAHKTLSGRDLTAGAFSFALKDATGTVIATATNAADGTVTFPTLTYTEVGAHEYTISEAAGSEAGMTYDRATFRLQVSVTDDGEGGLVATATYPDGEPSFANVYEKPSTPVDPSKPTDPSTPTTPGGGETPKPEVPKTGDASLDTAAAGLALGGLALVGVGAGALRRRRA